MTLLQGNKDFASRDDRIYRPCQAIDAEDETCDEKAMHSMSEQRSPPGTAHVRRTFTDVISDLSILTTSDEGTGNGLDADTVDGIEGASLVQTARTLTAGISLSGGGDLSANRTIDLDISGLGAGTGVTGSDSVLVYDDSGTAHIRRTWDNVVGDLSLLTADTEDQTITGGASVTTKDQGTKSSGTYTMDFGDRPVQKLANGGAFTLAPPTADGSCILHITNNGSAGAITTSGWTLVDGDAFTTTNLDEFICYCVRANAKSILTVKAL